MILPPTEPASSVAPFVGAPPVVRRLAWAGFAGTFVGSAVGAAFMPWFLVRSPLALIALAPEGRHLVLAAPSIPLLLFVAVVLVRRGAGLAATYVLAGIYGPAAVDWAKQRSPRSAGAVRFIERLFARVGPPLLVVAPIYSVTAIAGVGGTRPSVVLGCTTLGQVLWLLLIHRFGDGLSAWINPFVAWLGAHLAEATAVCVAVVVISQGLGWARRRARARASAS